MRSWAREIASQRIGGDDDDMEGQAKETIILVHGTWAAPQPGKTQWYQPAEGSASAGFAAKLDAALCDRGSPARCWAHGNDQSSILDRTRIRRLGLGRTPSQITRRGLDLPHYRTQSRRKRSFGRPGATYERTRPRLASILQNSNLRNSVYGRLIVARSTGRCL
jgi:hypothetical protein